MTLYGQMAMNSLDIRAIIASFIDFGKLLDRKEATSLDALTGRLD